MIWVEKKNFKNFHRSFLAISKKLFFCLFKICEPVIMYNSPNFQSISDFLRQLISTDLCKVYFSKFFCQSSHYWWPKITQPPKTSEIPKNGVLKIWGGGEFLVYFRNFDPYLFIYISIIGNSFKVFPLPPNQPISFGPKMSIVNKVYKFISDLSNGFPLH